MNFRLTNESTTGETFPDCFGYRQQRKSQRNSKYFIKITCIDERVIESKGKAKEIQNIEITYLDESLLRVVPVI